MQNEARELEIQTATEIIKLALSAIQSTRFEQATQHLERAEKVHEGIAPTYKGKKDPAHLEVGALIREGWGHMAFAKGEFDKALPHFDAALKARKEVESLDKDADPLKALGTLMACSSANQRLGKLDLAIAHNLDAIERLRPVDNDMARGSLIAALEGRATLLAMTDDFDGARSTFSEAESLVGAVTQASPGTLPMLKTQLFATRAFIETRANAPEAAFTGSEQALESCWAWVEAAPNDPRAIGRFVALQLAHTGFAVRIGRYADAEDALFKALRLAGPNPQIVQQALQFYAHLQKQTDEALEAGDLPRDEVLEGLATVQALAAKVKPQSA